ncbi:Endochitinase A2 precursor, putative [Perkinsus marinus ATCC 50983]|uniref:Endochitinase A2, putative n=1 Tax=Perkinsus marinus (strain ATCC 50983 / TXsc) TaxID=423536 RepID=C5KXB2_PERM5|nr:Endochitinase A2 precursor, putative [Perkinsus marinus ATCC 50983]EER10882.1 Endochitinase A2 precursor, putative [Perkinsus marinus ATCC 50983]|eukprot:XP_002779087.1 Endochitinase A2 precursor, putative [Perkinsus marinus ATCC 50983]
MFITSAVQSLAYLAIVPDHGVFGVDPPNIQRNLFPHRNGQAGPKPYTYSGLLAAVAKFDKFCNEAHGNLDLDTACKKELSINFAHFTQETGENSGWGPAPRWRQGLYFTHEIGCTAVACPKVKAIMAEYVFGDKYKLLKDADSLLTAEDGMLAFASAIWFLMTPQPPKPAIYDIVVGKLQPTARDKAGGRYPGFGETTLIINGALECSNPNDARAVSRIDFYKNFTSFFNVATGDHLSCGGMKAF